MKATVKALVNWDNDAVWGEANEEVVGDLRGLRWRQWPDLKSGYYPPATLELTLNNRTGTYTPTNGSSPLSGNLKAGRRVWVRLSYPHDVLDGTDGVDLSGRVFPNDSEFTWVKQNASSRGFEFASNQVREVVGSGDDAIYTVEINDSDAHLGFKFNRATNAGAGVVLRFISTGDYLAIKFGSLNTILVDHTGGVNTTLRSGTALTAGVNYFIEVEMHGAAIRALATNLDDGSWSRKEILDGGGTAGNLTATKHGLWHNGTANTDRWDDFGGQRSLFYGLLQELVPKARDQVAVLRCADDFARLEATRLHLLVTGVNQSPNNIMNSLLTPAGFSADDRELETGGQNLKGNITPSPPKAAWYGALEGLRACQDEEDGLIYMDGAGFIRLEISGHRAAGPHLTSRATLDDAKGAAPYFDGLELLDGSALVENDVLFGFSNPPDQGAQQVWKLRDVPAIGGGVTRLFLAESTKYAVVDNLTTPVATTDYTGNTQADGLGTDKTVQLAVTIDTVNYAGKGTMISVTNNDVATVYVTLLKLRASNAYLQEEETTHQAENSTSQAQYGVRSRVLSARFIDYYEAVRAVAVRRVVRRKDGKTLLEVRIPGHGHRLNLLQLVHRVVGDRVTVVWSDGGLNADFFIEGMDLEISAGRVVGKWLLQGV